MAQRYSSTHSVLSAWDSASEQFLPPDDTKNPTWAPPRQNEDGSWPQFVFALVEKEGVQHGWFQHVCLK